MAKNKKKQSKKDGVSEYFLDEAAQSLKKFRKVTKEIGKLSTGQKVAGGVALLAAGLTYWAKKQSEAGTGTTSASTAKPSPDAKAAEATLATLKDAPAKKEAPAKPSSPTDLLATGLMKAVAQSKRSRKSK